MTPCSDLSPAAWITSSDVPWHQLVTFGPQVFRSYARLRFLPDPTGPRHGEPTELIEPDAPHEFDLVGLALLALGEHTQTGDHLYGCVWDGWGTPPALVDLPKVVVPNRSYFLFSGTLRDFADWGADRPDDAMAGELPLPAFIWPEDRAWCIARDVDPHYAGIGAAPEAIDQLVAHPGLDVVVADPTQRQPSY